MFPIEQSSFLHALGYAIGHSLWQVPLLWLVYYVLTHIGKWSSYKRYALAVSMSIAGFGWFVLTLVYYASRLSTHTPVENMGVVWQQLSLHPNETNNFLFIYHSAMATLRSLAPYLSCAYLVVMMVLSVRLSFGFKQVKQLRSTGISKASIDWRLFVEDHAKLLGIKRKVQVLVSHIATSPYTVGFLKPIILLPLASINHLSTQQMEAILLHELAHIRRHDYLVNIVLQVVEISLFFNPFMRLLLKQARLERENSCDDWVLQFRYNPADYARALLAIEKHSMQSLLALGSNNHNEFELLNRVKRMVAPERQAFNYRQQLGLLFFITLLGLGFTVVVPRPDNANQLAKKIPTTQTERVTTIPEAPQVVDIVKSTPPAVDLVKTLENIQQHVEKAVESKEFKAQTKRIEQEAAAIANKVVAESEPYIKQMEDAAKDIELYATNKIANEIEASNYIAALKNSVKIAELYGNTNWDKVIGPALEQSGKALAMIPGVFATKVFQEYPPLEAFSKPTPPQKPTARPATAKNIQVITEDQKEMTVKLRDQHRLVLNLGNLQRSIRDSIKQAMRSVNLNAENQRSAQQQFHRAAEARKQAVAAPPPPPAPPRVFAYSNGSYNNIYLSTDEEEDEDLNLNYATINAVVVNTNSNNQCTTVAPKAATHKIEKKSVAHVVVDGRALKKTLKKEWVEMGANWEQIWNDEKIQLELHQAQEELQRGLKELEKLNIKANFSIKDAQKGKRILIEVETL
jgi:bla regulator protein BlaR1